MPIKLGTAFGFSGPYSTQAETQRQGVELAVDEINENGGLLGEEVEVLERDTELDSRVAIKMVDELLREEKVDLLVANISAEAAIQSNIMCKLAGTPYMAGCQTTRKFHREGFLYDASFTPYALNVQSIMASLEFALDEFGEDIFAIVPSYEWGQDSWRVLSEELGDSVDEKFHPLGEENFAPYIEAAEESGADVLLLLNFGKDQVKALKEINRRGTRDEMGVIVPVTALTVVDESPPRIWEDIYAGIQYYHAADNRMTREFKEAMEENYDYPGDSYAATTYTAVKEFERAINICESLKPEDVANALEENPDFRHTKTVERWRACDNQSIQDWFILKGKPMAERKDRWDVFEIAAKHGGEELLPDCDDY